MKRCSRRLQFWHRLRENIPKFFFSFQRIIKITQMFRKFFNGFMFEIFYLNWIGGFGAPLQSRQTRTESIVSENGGIHANIKVNRLCDNKAKRRPLLYFNRHSKAIFILSLPLPICVYTLFVVCMSVRSHSVSLLCQSTRRVVYVLAAVARLFVLFSVCKCVLWCSFLRVTHQSAMFG